MREQLEDVCREAERAGEIIKHMRAFVKKRDSNRIKCDLRKLVHDSVSLMHSNFRHKEIELLLELPDEPVYVFVDSIQLQQVILNLMMNAAEAMVPGDKKQLKVLCCTKQKKGQIIVRDSGPGIKPDDLERVFDFFFTTKRDGLGIGLSICRTIVEAHNGRIWAMNNENGCDFAFELKEYTQQDE